MKMKLMTLLLLGTLMGTQLSAQIDSTVEKIIKIGQTDNQTVI
nr:hypothetical protein [Ancylomarina sp. DW003]